MKHITKYHILTAVMIIVVAVTLNSCGGGGYGGGGMAVSGAGVFSITSPPSPADGAMGVGTTPTFAWTPSTGAADYLVQVDTTGSFTGPLLINAMTNSTTYIYLVSAGTLTVGTTYHWRIIAENIYGMAIAGPRTFTP